ncbi:MAG: hypothetical protein HZB21_00805 [Deltaproteobacteria bacterium]|nr:hypothetical protein [Deltaproteobacteria bacterium]
MAAFAVLYLGGCGGGGGGGGSSASGTALEIASKVSVVDAQTGGALALRSLNLPHMYLAPADIPSGSDYFNDAQVVYVAEGSAKAFNIINEILCSMAQAQYDAMVNQGAYKAQIDVKKCSSANDDASSAGESSTNQTSGSTAPEYEMWTVVSSRADNSSPHIVKVWIHNQASDFEPAKVIMANVSITEGVSSTNPYGLFVLNFRAQPLNPDGSANMTATPLFKGFLRSEFDAATNKVLLKFAMEGGFDISGDGVNDVTFDQKVVLDRASDGLSGSGSSYESNTGPGGGSTAGYDISFNSVNFLRSSDPAVTTDDMCYDRSAFEESAWRYGLYDSTGTRVDINSGFPIKTTGGAYGWIGYYGLWFPGDAAVANGDIVNKVTFGQGGGTETPYTVFISNGKLIKHTKKAITLGDIKGIPLDWHDNTASTNYRVIWDGTDFNKTQQFDPAINMWTDITPSAIALSSGDYFLFFWSQALGGEVRMNVRDAATGGLATLTDATAAMIRLRDIVYPADAIPASFACFDNCPDPASITGGNPYFPFLGYQAVAPDMAVRNDYTFDTTNMVMQYGGTDVVLSAANPDYPWGINSGALFEPTTANLDLLKCDWDAASTCPWQVWEKMDVFYTWETGVNQWNKFTALKSGAAYLAFDPPLSVVLTYTDAALGYSSAKFYLEYSGFGNLWGIPGKCIDWDTGLDVSCGPSTRWVPAFSIADGTEVIKASDGVTPYLVKALEKEQRMSNVALADCSTLTLTSYTLPSITDWVNPNIGTEPAVTNAPAVIGGVLQ